MRKKRIGGDTEIRNGAVQESILTNVLKGKGGINACFLHGENLPLKSPTWDLGEYGQV